jgi:hypothetical protein
MVEHDNGYKNLFSHSEMVRDLLLGFVKEDWVEQLDLTSLEKVSGSYVTDDLRDREDDIIWRIRWGDSWLYVYLLIEFQSTVDKYMALRIMVYVGLLYQDLIKSGKIPEKVKLPPVLPIVLYNGKPRWFAATEINDLIQDVGGGLGKYLPHLKYLLLDEGSFADEDLKPLKNLVAALFRLENLKSARDLFEIVPPLLEWLSDPKQASLHRAFTVWLSRVLFPLKFGKENAPAIEELEEIRTMLAETVKEWTSEWKKEGEARGVIKGEVEVLLRLINKKFGQMPSSYQNKIDNADSDILLTWSERVLTANSLKEVFENQ